MSNCFQMAPSTRDAAEREATYGFVYGVSGPGTVLLLSFKPFE